MTLPIPQQRADWIELAELRIANILRSRIAANIRQLEVKVCESGPPDKRPQPHILTTALRNFTHPDQGRLKIYYPKRHAKEDETRFYILTVNYPEPGATRVSELMVHYRVYRTLTNTEQYCSSVLEDIVRASFGLHKQYIFIGKGPKSSPLDAVYRFDSYKIGVEVKNIREWVYPHSPYIWLTIKKCLAFDAIPFLITRKLPYVTRLVFSRLGILGFEFHRQVFSPLVSHLLPEIQHTDKLGYKDVIALDPNQPHPTLSGFIQTTLPDQVPRYATQWQRQRPVLAEFAVDRDLANSNLPPQLRQQHYAELSDLLFQRDRDQPDDDDYL